MKPPETLLYLGPSGSFSEQIAWQIAPKFRIKNATPEYSLDAVAQNICEGKWGVLPYRDSLEGLLHESLDLLVEYQLKIVASFRLPILPSVGAYTNTLGSEGLKGYSGSIYSHRRAFRLCKNWLAQNCPRAKPVSVYSTAQAPEEVVKNRRGVAIAEISALRRNRLDVIERDIACGATDFFLAALQKEEITHLLGSNYKTLIGIAPREIGKRDFYENVVRIISESGLEISDRTGRPCNGPKDAPSDFEPEKMQVFYFEIKAHHKEEKVKKCIDTLTTLPVQEALVMGSYKDNEEEGSKPPSSIIEPSRKGPLL